MIRTFRPGLLTRSFQVEPGCVVISDEDGTDSRRQTPHALVKELAKTRSAARRVVELLEPSAQAYKARTGWFREYLEQLVKHGFGEELFKGLTVAEMQAACQRVVEAEGSNTHIFTRQLLRVAREQQIPGVLLSGSFTELVELFAKLHGIEIVCATQMKHVDGVYSGEILSLPVKDKGAAAIKIAKQYGFRLEVSIGLGDGPGDFKMLNLVGYPLLISPKEPKSRKYPVSDEGAGTAVISEKGESISCQRMNERGVLEDVRLTDVLPQPLASVLEHRLRLYLDYEPTPLRPAIA